MLSPRDATVHHVTPGVTRAAPQPTHCVPSMQKVRSLMASVRPLRISSVDEFLTMLASGLHSRSRRVMPVTSRPSGNDTSLFCPSRSHRRESAVTGREGVRPMPMSCGKPSSAFFRKFAPQGKDLRSERRRSTSPAI
jgi:hypothetical protein